MKDASPSVPSSAGKSAATTSSGAGGQSANDLAPVIVDLRDPLVAGVLAWLLPGAGHFYQRRFAKGILFMSCILAIYFFGLAMAEGRVVYASWNKVEKRWQYALQLGVGLPATPAILQSLRIRSGGEPLLGGIMAPPTSPEVLSSWHERLNSRFEMGTLYTVVAGLLNILAIYDAFAGPGHSEPAGSTNTPPIQITQDNKRRS